MAWMLISERLFVVYFFGEISFFLLHRVSGFAALTCALICRWARKTNNRIKPWILFEDGATEMRGYWNYWNVRFSKSSFRLCSRISHSRVSDWILIIGRRRDWGPHHLPSASSFGFNSVHSSAQTEERAIEKLYFLPLEQSACELSCEGRRIENVLRWWCRWWETWQQDALNWWVLSEFFQIFIFWWFHVSALPKDSIV